MDTGIAMLTVLLVVLVLALAVWAWRRPSRPLTRTEPWDAATAATGRQIVLDLVATDPDDPAVQRLAHETAVRALQSDPGTARVEVVDAAGTVLGVEARPAPLPEVALPDELHEPHLRRSRTPSVVPRPRPHATTTSLADAGDITVAAQPLADRLDLPLEVRRRVAEPERAVDVIRAILEQAGRTVEVHGDLVVSGDVAIAVVDTRTDPERALTHGYLRIQEAGAGRGIVLRLGHVDPRVIRRREASAPHVRHVAVDALQRMADAVAVGADPIAFAAGPVVRR